MTLAVPTGSFTNAPDAEHILAKRLFPVNGDLQKCKVLDAQAMRDVRSPAKYTPGPILFSKNGYTQGDYKITIANGKDVKLGMMSPYEGNKGIDSAFVFKSKADPSSTVMFWLKEGQQCDVQSEDVAKIDLKAAQVFRKKTI
ncbi:hypothetical protein CBS101457_005075 [Exobasidium rhododendri]|nr:hypothetical protein CBS101457_005075 [Exobasidium rhododendri]